MALIKCIECGREISNLASECPHCGCPKDAQPSLAGRSWPFDAVTPSEQPRSANDARRLMAVITEMKSRGENIPDDLIKQLQMVGESCREEWFQIYEKFMTNDSSPVVDLAKFAHDLRNEIGSDLINEKKSELINFVITRIEHFSEKVPFREAIFIQAILKNLALIESPEMDYFKERQRRGYPSLFENEAHIEWSANPGFYEQQLRIKHNNVFFPLHKQCVSLHDLYVSRSLDADERTEFLQHYKQFLEAFLQSNDVPASDVIDQLHTMYNLLEMAASIRSAESEMAQIRSAYQGLLTQIYQAWKDNPEAIKTLQAAENARWSGSLLTLNPYIYQFMRLVDKADVIPTMISQNIETIRFVMNAFYADGGIEDVKNAVREIITNNPGARDLLQKEPKKLEALGLSIDMLNSRSVAPKISSPDTNDDFLDDVECSDDTDFLNADFLNKFVDLVEDSKLAALESKGRPVNDVLRDYHKNGNIADEIPYKNGKKEGIAKKYDKNGKLQAEIPYKNDKIEGIRKWYNGGTLSSETPYVNGKKEGIEREYGVMPKEIPYRDGKKEGIAKYYIGETLHWETPYKNDKKEGIEKEYYNSGKLKCETPYKDGKKEGIEARYHEFGKLLFGLIPRKNDKGGKVFMLVPYKNDKIEGIAKEYYEGGELFSEVPCKNNKIEGVVKTYYPSGNSFIEVPYKNDKKEGYLQRYTKKGRLEVKILYKNNEPVNGNCGDGRILTNSELINWKTKHYFLDILERQFS